MLHLMSPGVPLTASATDQQQHQFNATSAILNINQQLDAAPAVQAEVIGRSQFYLERFPLPSFVSVFLGRLGDVYVADHTDDFVRLQILRAFEQSKKHHNKLTGAAILFDKIFQVMFHTDDTTRAITLRLLACISRVIDPTKAAVAQHKVLSCMESNSDVELRAALTAAIVFARNSPTYSHDVFDKLAEKFVAVDSDSTFRRTLASYFAGLDYDAVLFSKLQSLVESALAAKTERESACVLLQSLTTIAVSNVSYIPDVLIVLSGAISLYSDVKHQTVVLKCLLALTRFPHLWSEEVQKTICSFAGKSHFGMVRAGCFHVFIELFGLACQLSPGWCQYPPELHELALEAERKGQFLSIYASLVLSLMAVAASGSISSPNLKPEVLVHLHFCLDMMVRRQNIVITHPFIIRRFVGALKLAIGSGIVSIENVCQHILPLLLEPAVQSDLASTILRSLGYIMTSPHHIKVKFTNDYISSFLNGSSHSAVVVEEALKLLICSADDCVLGPALDEKFSFLVQLPWILYRLAIFSIESGRFHFAGSIIRQISSSYSLTVQTTLWLDFLSQLCDVYGDIAKLEQLSSLHTIQLIHSQLIRLEFGSVATTAQDSIVSFFRAEYLRLCSDVVALVADVLAKLRRLRYFSNYVAVLHDSVLTLSAIIDRLNRLRTLLIDADESTLRILDLLHECLAAFQEALSSVGDKNRLEKSLLALSKLFNSIGSKSSSSGGVVGAAVDLLRHVIAGPFPSLFFAAPQKTIVRLALSPQQPTPSDPVVVFHDTNFVLKVEGVIEQVFDGKRHHGRTIHSIHIKAVCDPRDSASGISSLVLESTEQVVGDYFSCEFPFLPPQPGIYLIRVTLLLVDKHMTKWHVVGPNGIDEPVTLLLKAAVADQQPK